MGNKSIVYVTQLPARQQGSAWVPKVDISPAREFGEIQVIVPPGLNHHDPQDALRCVWGGLTQFSEGDFLLPLGDPVLIIGAAAHLGHRFRTFQLLKWDRHMKRYFPVAIEVELNGNV